MDKDYMHIIINKALFDSSLSSAILDLDSSKVKSIMFCDYVLDLDSYKIKDFRIDAVELKNKYIEKRFK